MLTLYFAPNTCALASLIAFEEAGESVRIERVDFRQNAQRSPAYLAVNPKGRVPSLACDEGVLTETPAILAFIAQRHPAAQLAPVDSPFQFARAQAFNSYLCSTVHVAHAHRMRGHRWVDDAAAILAMQRKVPQSVGDAFAAIENGMLAEPWVLGDRYSICDGYLFTLAQWLELDGVDPEPLPRVLAHRRRVAERPAVQRALALERDSGKPSA